MRLFDNKHGSYATPENAIRKIRKELGDHFDDCSYIIGVNSEGRFIPIVTHISGLEHMKAHLAHVGICVC